MERGYKWGRFQAWTALAASIGLFVMGYSLDRAQYRELSLGACLSSLVCVLVWQGLLKKARYGFILYYVLVVLALQFLLWLKPSPELFGFALWWLIPGIFYYPKRWREFGFGGHSA